MAPAKKKRSSASSSIRSTARAASCTTSGRRGRLPALRPTAARPPASATSKSPMTELPTSKMGHADVLWAMKGRGAAGERVDLRTGAASPLPLRPSSADTIAHGFASVVHFFPGTKVLASELTEHLVRELLGAADVTKAAVFDDQYISTGGQFYELIVGHDRFNADLRPLLYGIQRQPE